MKRSIGPGCRRRPGLPPPREPADEPRHTGCPRPSRGLLPIARLRTRHGHTRRRRPIRASRLTVRRARWVRPACGPRTVPRRSPRARSRGILPSLRGGHCWAGVDETLNASYIVTARDLESGHGERQSTPLRRESFVSDDRESTRKSRRAGAPVLLIRMALTVLGLSLFAASPGFAAFHL